MIAIHPVQYVPLDGPGYSKPRSGFAVSNMWISFSNIVHFYAKEACASMNT